MGFQSRRDHHRTGAPPFRDRENEETVYHTHCMTMQGAISYRKSSVDLSAGVTRCDQAWPDVARCCQADSPLNWPCVCGIPRSRRSRAVVSIRKGLWRRRSAPWWSERWLVEVDTDFLFVNGLKVRFTSHFVLTHLDANQLLISDKCLCMADVSF